MSQENVELHQRLYDAFNRRRLASTLALIDDDVEGNSLIVAIEGRYHGHEGMRRMWEDVLNAVPDLIIEAAEISDAGDSTIATARLRGHGAGSDAPFDQTLWVVGRWRHGKLVWWGDFYTRSAALEAAGLSEHAD